MTTTMLAKQLRQCQYRLGKLPRHLLDGVPDEDIIERYVICPGCGEWLVTGDELVETIADCKDVDEFVAFADKLLQDHGAKK